MGSAATTTELGLAFHPATMTRFLGGMHDSDSKVLKMEEYVHRLEEERRKIEAFKRELPLCMLILTDVISALKEEVTQRRRGMEHRPVLEQFLPQKNREEQHDKVEGEDNLERDVVHGDKMNWMSSAQLWSDNSSDCNTESNSNAGTKMLRDERASDADRQSESGNPFGGGDTFVPFKVVTPPLAVPDPPILSKTLQPMKAKFLVSPFVGAAQPNNLVDQQQQQQGGPRKVRRCWSPELHRRFVGALQQLGGPQAATPKQIRDLMKVDGLTNDEVKSHLQKYRLHTRRPTPSNGSANQTALLGGLWVQPKDQHYATSKPSDSQSASGSPKGPLQFAVAGGGTQGVSLTGVDSCDEDMKSESFSWKGNQRGEEEIDV